MWVRKFVSSLSLCSLLKYDEIINGFYNTQRKVTWKIFTCLGQRAISSSIYKITQNAFLSFFLQDNKLNIRNFLLQFNTSFFPQRKTRRRLMYCRPGVSDISECKGSKLFHCQSERVARHIVCPILMSTGSRGAYISPRCSLGDRIYICWTFCHGGNIPWGLYEVARAALRQLCSTSRRYYVYLYVYSIRTDEFLITCREERDIAILWFEKKKNTPR